MAQHLTKDEKIFLELDTSELSGAQVRLVKSLHNMITHILSTDDEGEYFDGSAEVIRIAASLVKQAKFAQAMKNSDIPYAEQVLEFSLDILQEQMSQSKVITYDC